MRPTVPQKREAINFDPGSSSRSSASVPLKRRDLLSGARTCSMDGHEEAGYGPGMAIPVPGGPSTTTAQQS
jgi:hypothetical protein